jgi:hypothetical protein
MPRACWSSQTSSERSESRSSRFTLQFRWRDPRRRSRSGTHDRRSGLTLTGWCYGRTALTTSTARRLSARAVISLRLPPQRSSGVRWEVSCSRELLSARRLHRRFGCVDGSFRPVPPARPLAASSSTRACTRRRRARRRFSSCRRRTRLFTTPNLYQRLQPHDPHG